MSTTSVRQDLSYTVTITRARGEAWPRILVSHGTWAEVTEVDVRVIWEDGELQPQTPDIMRARRVLKSGSLGAPAGRLHGYYSFWERDEAQRDAINAQSDAFRQQALETARDMFGILVAGVRLADEAAALAQEPAPVRDVVLSQRPELSEPAKVWERAMLAPRPGESAASRRQALELLAGFGVNQHAAQVVLKLAYHNRTHSSPFRTSADRDGYVTYDSDTGIYTVLTKAEERL